MPTYYNGKEITSTSTLSGLSLVGRSSITIGGKVITLSTPPPVMFIYGDGSYRDSPYACMFGPRDGFDFFEKPSTKVYIQDNDGHDYRLFYNPALTLPVKPGFYWANDTTNIGGGISSLGSSISVTPRGLVETQCG